MNVVAVKHRLAILLFFILSSSIQPSYAVMGMGTLGLFTVGSLASAAGAFALGLASRSSSESPSEDSDSKIKALTADSIIFNTPGNKTLEITNPNDQEIMVDTISLNNLTGVSIEDPSTCQSIAAHGTCSITLTATQDAYGIGSVMLQYNNKYTISHIYVDSVDLDLYRCRSMNNTKTKCVLWKATPVPLTQDIRIEREKLPQFFRYLNNDKFSWQKKGGRYIDFKTEFPPGTDIELEEISGNIAPNSKCDEASIEPGEFCAFKFTSSDNLDHPKNTAVLRINGENLGADIYKNIINSGGLEIVINRNSEALHLGYRSLKIVNMVENKNVTISKFGPILPDPTISNQPDRVKYCSPTDSDCLYKTECEVGKILQSKGYCKVWFKALSNETALDKDTDIVLTLETQGTFDNGTKETDLERDSFRVHYEQSLYAGGDFSQAGGKPANHIAKWDGSTWSPLAIGINGSVNSIIATNGDLYAGGSFTFTTADGEKVNNIARWNGSTWSELGSGTNNTVSSLTSINNNLYAAGPFTSAGGREVKQIAKWDADSLTWSKLGLNYTITRGTVDTLTHIGDDLYAGGTFNIQVKTNNSLYNKSIDKVAKWNGSIWSPLPSMSNTDPIMIRSLTNIGNTLYAIGIFLTANRMINKIAEWYTGWNNSNSSGWLTLNSGYNSDDDIHAMTSINNDLYVAGSFTSMGTQQINRIARYYPALSSWSSLGSGITGTDAKVSALTTIGDNLYAGGTFTTAGETEVNNIAEWDGSTWSELGEGVDANIRSITIIPSLVIEEHIT